MKSISKRSVSAIFGLAVLGACAGGDDRPPAGSCFSPEQTPELALEQSGAGCSCHNEKDQCITIPYQGQTLKMGLACTAGRWEAVDDGPCSPAPSP